MQNSQINKSLHISPQFICFVISKQSALAYSQGYTDSLAYAFMVFTFSVLLWPCSLVIHSWISCLDFIIGMCVVYLFSVCVIVACFIFFMTFLLFIHLLHSIPLVIHSLFLLFNLCSSFLLFFFSLLVLQSHFLFFNSSLLFFPLYPCYSPRLSILSSSFSIFLYPPPPFFSFSLYIHMHLQHLFLPRRQCSRVSNGCRGKSYPLYFV